METAEDQMDGMASLPGTEFDAIQYLDEHLPSLSLTSQGTTAKQNRSSQLQSLSTDIQAQVSRWNAHNARTSTELSILTDEILRSGNRLAYEVEVLRSDANSLFDLLSDTLRDDIQHLVGEASAWQLTKVDVEAGTVQPNAELKGGTTDPEFMQQLRLLGHVKARLDEVIQVFGNALKWPIPPSDVSMASQLISVSAPELGVVSSADDDKARATIRQLREEVLDLLNSDGGGYTGLQAAQKRVEEYQNLALVWKGTVEERARSRVVDGFVKIVEDRRRALDSQSQPRKSYIEAARASGLPSRSGTPSLPAGGLLGGLRKLRDEIYLD